MCALCEIKTEDQLTFAFRLLDRVWDAHEDDTRGWLRTYLIEAIEQYEERHMEIRLPTIGAMWRFQYEHYGRVCPGRMFWAMMDIVGARMWRALLPRNIWVPQQNGVALWITRDSK